jgi:hypothetical protein
MSDFYFPEDIFSSDDPFGIGGYSDGYYFPDDISFGDDPFGVGGYDGGPGDDFGGYPIPGGEGGGGGDGITIGGPPSGGFSTQDLFRILQQGGSQGLSILGRIIQAAGGGSGGNPLGFLERLIGGGSGLGNGILENPLLLPSLVAARQQWKDSDRYMERADSWANQADPFGSQRPQYQEHLQRLMTDPEGYVKDDPFYQSMLRTSMNPVASKMRARGYGNSGNILSELTRVSSDVTNKYVGDLADRLGRFGGAQFGPETAANMRMRGLEGSINSRNAALNSLMYPFLATAFNQQGRGGNTGGGNGGGGFNINDIFNLFPGNPNSRYPSGGDDDEGITNNPTPSPAYPGSGEDNIYDRTAPINGGDYY